MKNNINNIRQSVFTDNNGNIIIPKTIAEAIFVSYVDEGGNILSTTLDKALYTIRSRIDQAVPINGNVGQVLTKTSDGTEWADVNGFVISATTPTNNKVLWVDSANSYLLKVHNGTDWIPVAAAWAE